MNHFRIDQNQSFQFSLERHCRRNFFSLNYDWNVNDFGVFCLHFIFHQFWSDRNRWPRKQGVIKSIQILIKFKRISAKVKCFLLQNQCALCAQRIFCRYFYHHFLDEWFVDLFKHILLWFWWTFSVCANDFSNLIELEFEFVRVFISFLLQWHYQFKRRTRQLGKQKQRKEVPKRRMKFSLSSYWKNKISFLSFSSFFD